jgi:hypothetical protein
MLWLQHIVDVWAMNAVAASRTFFGVALLWSSCSGSITSSSSIFLPLKPFAEKSLHKKFTSFSDNHYVFGFIVEGMPIDILWNNLQRLTNPILVVNILHMPCIPKFKKNNHNLYGVFLADYDGTLFSEKR